ncbi:MAG: hypothetical protein ABIZ71_02585 [Gemmatimonadales bacterium]
MTVAVDRRSHDLVSIPRAGLEESWMDVTARAFEARRSIGRAYVEVKRHADPLPHLFDADRRLVSLTEFARRQAGEAAGIRYIEPVAPGQLPLPDSCFDGKSTA